MIEKISQENQKNKIYKLSQVQNMSEPNVLFYSVLLYHNNSFSQTKVVQKSILGPKWISVDCLIYLENRKSYLLPQTLEIIPTV